MLLQIIIYIKHTCWHIAGFIVVLKCNKPTEAVTDTQTFGGWKDCAMWLREPVPLRPASSPREDRDG